MSHTPTRRRAASGITVAAALLSTFAAPAHALADGCGASGQGLDCNLSGVTGGRGGGSGGGNGGGGSGGVSGPVAPPDPEGLTDNQAVDGVDTPGGNAPPAAQPPDVWAMMQRVKASAPFPVPTAYTAPKDKTFVRLRTNLWVDGFTVVQTDPISQGGVTVQATATPTSVNWNLGETQITCTDAGSETGKTCGYTYRRSSTGQPGGAWQITATITWRLAWTCTGAVCGGGLDDHTMTSEPTALVVSEIQTNTHN